jgi:hypothetical protein
MMKKVMMSVLVMLVAVGLASASPVMQLGDVNGVFAPGNTAINTTVGSVVDLYVWASNDIPLLYDENDEVLMESGLDNLQVYFQFNPVLANIATTGKLTGVSGNPYGTSWSGRTLGTYAGASFIEGALLPSGNADAFELRKIVKLSVTVAGLGAAPAVSLLPDVSITHQSFQGNSVAGTQFFAPAASVTFVPEPVSIVLLAIGGLGLLRRKS